jgi:hypothetical protein
MMEKDSITTAMKIIFDEAMNFKSVRKYLAQLALSWPTEKLVELLAWVLYRTKVTNDYTTSKRNGEIKPYYGTAFGSEIKSGSGIGFGPLIPLF